MPKYSEAIPVSALIGTELLGVSHTQDGGGTYLDGSMTIDDIKAFVNGAVLLAEPLFYADLRNGITPEFGTLSWARSSEAFNLRNKQSNPIAVTNMARIFGAYSYRNVAASSQNFSADWNVISGGNMNSTTNTITFDTAQNSGIRNSDASGIAVTTGERVITGFKITPLTFEAAATTGTITIRSNRSGATPSELINTQFDIKVGKSVWLVQEREWLNAHTGTSIDLISQAGSADTIVTCVIEAAFIYSASAQVLSITPVNSGVDTFPFYGLGVDGAKIENSLLRTFGNIQFNTGGGLKVENGFVRAEDVTPNENPLSKVTYVGTSLVGNSDVINFGETIHFASTFFNKGVGGDKLDQILARITDILSTNADMYVLEGGTNDCRSTVQTQQNMQDNWIAIVKAMQETGADVVGCTIPPYDMSLTADPTPAVQFAKWDGFNIFLRTWGPQNNVPIVDLALEMIDGVTLNTNLPLLNPEYADPDGIHMTNSGQDFMGVLLANTFSTDYVLGLLVEDASSSTLVNSNRNDLDVSEFVLSGSAVADLTLTIVDDRVALEASGMHLSVPNKVYKMTRVPGVAGSAMVELDGNLPDADFRTLSCFARVESETAALRIGYNNNPVGTTQALTSNYYTKLVESSAPNAVGRRPVINLTNVGEAYFILQQIEKAPFDSSPILLKNETKARGKDDLSTVLTGVTSSAIIMLEFNLIKTIPVERSIFGTSVASTSLLTVVVGETLRYIGNVGTTNGTTILSVKDPHRVIVQATPAGTTIWLDGKIEMTTTDVFDFDGVTVIPFSTVQSIASLNGIARKFLAMTDTYTTNQLARLSTPGVNIDFN